MSGWMGMDGGVSEWMDGDGWRGVSGWMGMVEGVSEWMDGGWMEG